MSAHDRELRRAVARLRALPASDFEAILDGLEMEQRSRILALLNELEGLADGAPGSTPELVADVLLPPDLSPWMVARVNGCGESAEETSDQFTMTAHTHSALRRCAAALVPQPTPLRHSTSLFGWIVRKLRTSAT